MSTIDLCCGATDLRTACLIIGYIELVITTNVLAYCCCYLAYAVNEASHDNTDVYHELGRGKTSAGLILNGLIETLAWVILAFIIVIFKIVLLIGIHKNKSGHVKTYLLCNIIMFISKLVTFFFNFVTKSKQNRDILVQSLNIVLSIYFILVIRKYYMTMEDTRRRQRSLL